MKGFKNILAIISVALMYSACTSDMENESKLNIVHLRSQSEAINIAEDAYSVFNTERGCRAEHAPKATATNVQSKDAPHAALLTTLYSTSSTSIMKVAMQ